MISEPTREEIQMIWEWCGVPPRFISGLKLTLDNLFEYAIPKLAEMKGFRLINYQYIGFAREVRLLRHNCGILFEDEKWNVYETGDNLVSVLFRAIQTVVTMELAYLHPEAA